MIKNISRQAPTAEEIYTALSCIPADDRNIWIQIGMAVKSELGNDGYSLWDQWSQSADSYREQDARAVWRSFKTGRISISTLFHYAKMHGHRSNQKPAATPQKKPAPSAPTHNTAIYALKLWLKSDSSEVRTHPYAIKKGIKWPAGAGRVVASGKVIGRNADCIIVPIRDIATGKVISVQCINTEGAKQTFGPVSGNGLLLGNTLNKTIPWYICEGWASAVSMVFHHQNGHGVCAASFGKSNQEKLAQKIAEIHDPDEIIILREVD